MTDHPIIFSSPMVLALLAGRKTMTRRLADQEQHYRMNGALEVRCKRSERTHSIIEPSPWQRVQPGDRLWVRESAAFVHDEDTREATKVEGFAADGFKIAPALVDFNVRFRPSIHMPRWASRLTLIVTATKIERLWDISDADCMAEGIVFETADPPFYYVPGLPHDLTGVGIEERADLMPHAVQCFRKLWMHLHGREGWDENPEVVALSFTVHKQNIDALAEAA